MEKRAQQNGCFLSVLGRLLVTMLLLFNSPSTTYRFVHNDGCIRASNLLQVDK